MSGAVPPWNWVTNWSCTESQEPWLYFTWMFGWAAFQSVTIFCTAAIVGFWKARLWNVSVTLSPELPALLPLDELHAASAPVARIAAVAATNVALHFTVGSFFLSLIHI